MKFPVSWLRELIEIPADVSTNDIGNMLTSLSFEVESIDVLGHDLIGPIVVGRILNFSDEPQKNGKTIRWCQVDVGDAIRGIVCGANNFFEGDLVVVALPGAVLPGDFAITARDTYGHTSDGMICSARELGMGDDHSGILRLETLGIDAVPGADALSLLELHDEVIDISVLPDRGYAMSMRGICRELAAVTGWKWNDPAVAIDSRITTNSAAVGVQIEDANACDRIVIRTIDNYSTHAISPYWMQRRLRLCGIRSISLAVDVTNYVMLELGQPLHAFDADKLQGPIRVRSANSDRTLKTLDDVNRTLFENDIVISDDSGPIGLAGTMGGASTEITEQTTRIALEAAHFAPARIAQTSRRHNLGSEASRRFERGVDPGLPAVASARASELLQQFASSKEVGAFEAGSIPAVLRVLLKKDFASRIIGGEYTVAEIETSLRAIGCNVQTTNEGFDVEVPSWRSDLRIENDFAEEVARFYGYERIAINQPPAAFAGRNVSIEQRRRALNFLAQQGLVEVLNYPFIGSTELNRLGLPSSDNRRNLVSIANPLNSEQDGLRTTLLPGLLSCLERNLGRGNISVPIFEYGAVFLGGLKPSPIFTTETKPSQDQITELFDSVGSQPRYLAAIVTGQKGADSVDWSWKSIVSLVDNLARVLGVSIRFEQTSMDPWHPGRSAAIVKHDNVIGFVGELHPLVSKTLGTTQRLAAFELDFDALIASASIVQVQRQSNLPFIGIDVSLIVDEHVKAEALVALAKSVEPDITERVTLLDIYRGQPIEDGRKSVTLSLTLRSFERTLTDDEAVALRTRIVEKAQSEFGAYMRDVK